MVQLKDKVLSGDESYQTDFHYRFEKELQFATKKGSTEAAPGYVKVTIKYNEWIPEEQLTSWHLSRAPLYNPSYVYSEEELMFITPITAEEYMEAQEDEDAKVRVGDVLGFYL